MQLVKISSTILLPQVDPYNGVPVDHLCSTSKHVVSVYIGEGAMNENFGFGFLASDPNVLLLSIISPRQYSATTS